MAADSDIPPMEEIQSKLRLLRRNMAHRSPRVRQVPRQTETTNPTAISWPSVAAPEPDYLDVPATSSECGSGYRADRRAPITCISSPSSARTEDENAPVPTPSPARSSRRDEGVQYLTAEELEPLPGQPSTERFFSDCMRRLSSSDWFEQFVAIDDIRRLTRFAPDVAVNTGQLRKVVAAIATIADSLRSALTKNSLRCLGELFLTYGRKLDADVEGSLPVAMRRAADTNLFIAEEAESCLREVCRAASEPKALSVIVLAVSHRQPRIRVKAVWCLAMITQRILSRGACPSVNREIRVIAEAATKASQDANADVRQSSRIVATLLAYSGGPVFDECGVARHKLAEIAVPGVDLNSFDVFDTQCLENVADHARGVGACTSTSSHHGRSRLSSNR